MCGAKGTDDVIQIRFIKSVEVSGQYPRVLRLGKICSIFFASDGACWRHVGKEVYIRPRGLGSSGEAEANRLGFKVWTLGRLGRLGVFATLSRQIGPKSSGHVVVSTAQARRYWGGKVCSETCWGERSPCTTRAVQATSQGCKINAFCMPTCS